MRTPPSYTSRLVSSGNCGAPETKYAPGAGPSYMLNVPAAAEQYRPRGRAGGYGSGAAGHAYLRIRKRRPRRPFFGKGCNYCGGTFNDKPLVAAAVTPTGRLVDTKRLSVPHCDGCGIRAA